MAAGSYELKEFTGGAPVTALAAPITGTPSSFSVVSGGGSSYPTGSTAPFVVVLGKDTASEEKVLISTRVGDVFNISVRGYDDTASVDHDLGEQVHHALDASTIAQANSYVNLQSSKGDLVVHNGSNPVVQSVGNDNEFLVADSSTASGVAFKTIDDLDLATETYVAGLNLATQTYVDNSISDTETYVDTHIASQTLSILNAPIENWNVVAAAASGTINVNVQTAAVWIYTSNATGNWTLNFRGDASTTLDSLINTGDALTVGFVSSNGATAYKPSTIQVDGSTKSVKWQGAYSSGRVNATDFWLFTLLKTATNTWQVFGSVGSYL